MVNSAFYIISANQMLFEALAVSDKDLEDFVALNA